MDMHQMYEFLKDHLMISGSAHYHPKDDGSGMYLCTDLRLLVLNPATDEWETLSEVEIGNG